MEDNQHCIAGPFTLEQHPRWKNEWDVYDARGDHPIAHFYDADHALHFASWLDATTNHSETPKSSRALAADQPRVMNDLSDGTDPEKKNGITADQEKTR